MKSKTMILMVVAVVCGLVASYLTSQLIAAKNKKVQILVAKKAIPQSTPIKNPGEFFEQREWAESDAPQGAVTDMKDLQDRVVLKDIAENTPVAINMLQDKSKVGLEGMLAPKTRGIAITVNAATTAGGFVQPGSHVDVVHTVRAQGTSDSKMILENVLVRAVDQQPVRPEDKASMIPATVTLELTPEQALKLCQYKEGGSLTLLLRPFGDNTKLEADKGEVALNKPPTDDKKVTPRRDNRFVQFISNGPATKATPYIQRDKKWINDPDSRTDGGPSGSGEGN
jgi:pilus assembly protein CpaB